MKKAWYWKILYALFPDLEFLHLRREAEFKHPDKKKEISEIAQTYIHKTNSVLIARESFEKLGETK